MSTIAQRSEASVRTRAGRFAVFVTIAVVLAVSVAEFINLAGRHTIGAESYGLLVAGLAVAAGILSLALVSSPRRWAIVTVAVVVLWVIVALGGVAGTYYHIVGVAPEYSPVDPRPRPVVAPLVFTLLGLVGGAALLVGQRSALRSLRNPWKE